MPLLNILLFPDPRLKKVAEPIQQVDDNIKQIVRDLFETMYHAEGVGLAATQANIHQRIIVIDVSENRNEPLCLINPIITKKEGSTAWEEGCLSFPNIYTKIKRFTSVTVEYQDLDGKPHTISADGLLSICLQHEIDHLNGITFYNRISPLKQAIMKNKLKKMGNK